MKKIYMILATISCTIMASEPPRKQQLANRFNLKPISYPFSNNSTYGLIAEEIRVPKLAAREILDIFNTISFVSEEQLESEREFSLSYFQEHVDNEGRSPDEIIADLAKAKDHFTKTIRPLHEKPAHGQTMQIMTISLPPMLTEAYTALLAEIIARKV